MDFALPPVGEGLYEVELVRWLVKPGDVVTRGQSLMEVLSDKATMEVTATFAGTVTALHGEPGSKVKVGQVVLRYSAVGETANGVEIPGPTAHASQPAQASGNGSVAVVGSQAAPPSRPANGSTVTGLPLAAPSVRHMARHLGIDLTAVRGSGPAGRILIEDLSAYIRPAAVGAPRPDKPETGPKLELGRAGTKFQVTGLRRKIAEKMIESTRSIPHYSYIDECDVSDLVRLRTQLKDTLARSGVKLTFLPFIIKAISRALKQVPLVNSTYDEPSNEVTLHDHYNIGFAVAAPSGLIVPVIKDVDKKDLFAIATEIDRLSSDARQGKARIEDLRGGTFTVTSIGNIGGLISTPIINPPETGIVGVGKVVKRPRYDAAGVIHPAEILYLSFSFDHRILDGAVGATFGNAVIKQLTNPAALLLPERFAG